MADLLERISIVVDGYRLQGFQTIEVTRSMQAGAISFSLEASAASWSPQAMALRDGKQLEIYTSPDRGQSSALGSLLATGAIDDYASEHDETAHKINLTGRSKSRNAIDCPPVKHKTGLVKKKTLLDAAREFDEFGVGWNTDQHLDPIDVIQRHPDEAMFDTIERYARRQGLMLMGQPDGSVLITRAGTKRHAGALVLGQSPVNKFGVTISTAHKPSHVVVRGQRRRGTGKDNLRQEAVDRGEGEQNRPALVLAEGDHTLADLKKRAKWERLRRAAYGVRPSITASRWRDAAGEVWEPGRLVALRNDPEKIDGDFTLSSVRLSQRDGDGTGAGTRAFLEFVDPRAHGGQAGAGKSDKVFSPGDGL